MEIVIDEWIVHYMSDPEKHEIIFRFLKKVFKKCDRFVTVRGRGLDQKIWQIAKKSAYWNPESRRLVKWFMGSFRHNSKKFHILEESNISLPLELEQETPPDDLYLVKAAIATKSFIVTTDYKLKRKLSHWKEITVYMVDEFLDLYDC